jgi:hypothetical protein
MKNINNCVGLLMLFLNSEVTLQSRALKEDAICSLSQWYQ